LQKDYVVTVSAGGTTAGILGIAERKNDIAMASREVMDEERQNFGNDFMEFPVGLDGISLAVSDEIYLAGVMRLSRPQVREIYSGNITNWKEVGGPDAEIYVISREEGSGTRDNFNEIVLGQRRAETPGVDTVAMSTAEVKSAISGSNKAIGYLGFNYLGEGVTGIAYDGIPPTYENIKLDLYELHRHLYVQMSPRWEPRRSLISCEDRRARRSLRKRVSFLSDLSQDITSSSFLSCIILT